MTTKHVCDRFLLDRRSHRRCLRLELRQFRRDRDRFGHVTGIEPHVRSSCHAGFENDPCSCVRLESGLRSPRFIGAWRQKRKRVAALFTRLRLNVSPVLTLRELISTPATAAPDPSVTEPVTDAFRCAIASAATSKTQARFFMDLRWASISQRGTRDPLAAGLEPRIGVA